MIKFENSYFQFQNLPQNYIYMYMYIYVYKHRYSTEINLYIQGQLNFNKGVKIIHKRKNSLFNKWLPELDIPIQKNKSRSLP